MKSKKILVAIAAGVATMLVAPAAAHASDTGGWLCSTRDATPVYAYSNFTSYLFTLSPGRGFRVHIAEGVDATWTKFYGHGAERPGRDGWVRAQHIYCL
jgi:hypothetical protein